MTTERIVDSLIAPHAMEAAKRLYKAARAEIQIVQQPLAISASPGALAHDPWTGNTRLVRHVEHIIEDGQWVTRLEAV